MVKKDEVIIILKDIEKRNGVLMPETLIEEAANENHPLHNRFEWDDSTAGHFYRLQQARTLINQVKVIWKHREVEQFHNVIIKVGDAEQRGYVSYQKVISNVDLHKQVLSEAAREITYWQEKYNTLKEFKGVINQKKLDRVVAAL